MRIKLRTDVKVGIIAIVVIAILIWGINFLKGKDVFRKQNTYYAVYYELNGLLPSSSVFIGGLKTGRVTKISYVDPSLKKFILEFQINSDIRLPKNSTAKIYSSDLLGSKALEINMGDSPVFCENKDTILTDYAGANILDEVSRQIEPIKNQTMTILKDIDTIVSSLKVLLNRDNQSELAQILQHANVMSLHLAQASMKMNSLLDSEKGKITGIVSNVENITLNLKQNNEKIANIITNFSDISDTLVKANISKTLQDADNTLSSLSNIVQKIEKGNGNIGMLVNNDSLYLNIERSMKSLDMLIEDIRKNPKRYVHVSVF